MRVYSVSYSSDKTLARCEMQYHLKYEQNLRPRLKKQGIWRGEWMHELQAAHYRMISGQKTSWKVRFEEMKSGLWNKLFDEEKEMYGEDFPDVIYGLMEHYVEHWKGDKRWKIEHIEKKFSLDTKFGFPVRMIGDLIVMDGKHRVLVETKNKKDIPESNERIMAPQVHGYCYLLERLGFHIDRILWNYVRTTKVSEPKINKDGSISKRKIDTDRRTYLRVMNENGIEITKGLEDYIDSLPETLSLKRISNSPNLLVGESFVRDWINRGRRAQGIKNPIRNFTRSCGWECDFYELCQKQLLREPTANYIKQKFVQITHGS